MGLDFKSFERLILTIRRYYNLIDNLEKALGGIVLEDFYELPSVLGNEIEKVLEVEFPDDVWAAINLPSANCPIKDIWDRIQNLKETNNG